MASLTVAPVSHAAPAPSRAPASASDASNTDASDKKRRKPGGDTAAINGEAATAAADSASLASAQRTQRAAAAAVRTIETPKAVLVDTTPTETA